MAAVARDWWKNAICYMIDVADFCDGNGDGIGDLTGLNTRLAYLKELGVDIVILSSLSGGVNSQEDIETKYGTMQDLDRLVAKGRRLGIRFVITVSVSKETTYDYLSEVIKFWFKKGLVGFNFNFTDTSINLESYHELIQGLNTNIFSKHHRWVSLARPMKLTIEEAKSFTDEMRQELDMVMPLNIIEPDMRSMKLLRKKPDLRKLADSLDSWQSNLGWPANYFEYDCNRRCVDSLFDTEKLLYQRASLIAGLTASLTGTPFIYAGQEAGLRNGQTCMSMADQINAQDEDTESLLSFFKSVMDFRKNSEALSIGNYRRVAAPRDIYVFTRESENERLYIYANLTPYNRLTELFGDRLVFSNYGYSEEDALYMRPYEFRIIKSNF